MFRARIIVPYLPEHRAHEKPASDDDGDNMMQVHQGNFLAIINTFAKIKVKRILQSKDIIMRKCFHGT